MSMNENIAKKFEKLEEQKKVAKIVSEFNKKFIDGDKDSCSMFIAVDKKLGHSFIADMNAEDFIFMIAIAMRVSKMPVTPILKTLETLFDDKKMMDELDNLLHIKKDKDEKEKEKDESDDEEEEEDEFTDKDFLRFLKMLMS